MIANGDKNLAIEYLNNYVHILGNLTITGYNQNLSNLSFEKKKNRVNKDAWHIEDIKERTNRLVDFFMKEFEL